MMINRDFVQLAKPWEPDKKRCINALGAGLFLSDKLDGMRALWLPGTVGKCNLFNELSSLPATGLWSRYGKVIWAPEWFTIKLPLFPLDGELYLGPQRFNETISYVTKNNPINSEWDKIQYMVFDSPRVSEVLLPGRINNANWVEGRIIGNEFEGADLLLPYPSFEYTYEKLLYHQHKFGYLTLEQTKVWDKESINVRLNAVLEKEGEGVMLRNNTPWEPRRSFNVFKYKDHKDDEATVIGTLEGKGKFEGMLGALEVRWKGVVFSLGTGFKDSERREIWKVGDRVTFRYRELTPDGIPREGRFLRRYRPV